MSCPVCARNAATLLTVSLPRKRLCNRLLSGSRKASSSTPENAKHDRCHPVEIHLNKIVPSTVHHLNCANCRYACISDTTSLGTNASSGANKHLRTPNLLPCETCSCRPRERFEAGYNSMAHLHQQQVHSVSAHHHHLSATVCPHQMLCPWRFPQLWLAWP